MPIQTHLGHTPAQFFAEPLRAGRPRFVIPVGLPGSGKTRWLNEARSRGWVVINADEIRMQRLKDMKARGELLDLGNGELVEPDAANPEHVFCDGFREDAYRLADAALIGTLEQGKNLVWDATNLDHKRVPKIYQARSFGYFVEALIFQSSDLEINARNIGLRAIQGGLDLARRVPDPRSPEAMDARLRILLHLQNVSKKFPIADENVMPSYLENSESLPEYIPDAPGALGNERIYRKHDVFNAVEYIRVQDWSK